MLISVKKIVHTKGLAGLRNPKRSVGNLQIQVIGETSRRRNEKKMP